MLSVCVWKRPWEPSPSAFGHLGQVTAAEGDLLVLRLQTPADGAAAAEIPPTQLPATVRQLRERHPACPVVLWIPNAPPQVVIEAVRAGSQAQVRAILGGEALDPGLLRVQLTHPQGLSAFVLRWASDAGYLPPGVEEDDVRALLDAAPDVRTLQRLSLCRHVAARTWRSHLQQLGLPTPHAWMGLAHALHVAFFVQRNQTDSLATLCARLRMQTVANMSQQFKRVFGLPPSAVRDLLGAEPLLHRWFRERLGR